jgi:hypothetical protein
MRATITTPHGVKIEVDASFDEIMRLACQPGHSVFLPACTCSISATHTCRQHPRQRVDQNLE